MVKLQSFDNKKTKWNGLWKSSTNSFVSGCISLAELRKFKGNVRLVVSKNKYYNKGENGRPNYIFTISSYDSQKVSELTVEDADDAPYMKNGNYYTPDGERLYTYEEVEYAVGRASEDGRPYEGMGYLPD